ncbi:hypothetical protein [Mesorhizobium sp. LNJC403B00]|uniref:hypothetical protein n=1 Tax=Mesorhizobium sp. LNJC403B00 TaxID=1287280 RepID=UPI0003CF8E7F|nr:hypothetical protein [Mesorhizobium sp. LNJC403B00]ESX97317.1 hypothetical protein X754_03850 [Mesorhizobium sp. LNJC403B00]
MPVINDLGQLRADLERRASTFAARARELFSGDIGNLDQQMKLLQQFRSQSYELLNQLQHEFLIIRALDWLKERPAYGRVTRWTWHPTSTGTATEPDLLGCRGEVALISAEITTWANPDGVIDQRMRRTLCKLANMPGERFYFVSSATMAARATTKVGKANYPITVVNLNSDMA